MPFLRRHRRLVLFPAPSRLARRQASLDRILPLPTFQRGRQRRRRKRRKALVASVLPTYPRPQARSCFRRAGRKLHRHRKVRRRRNALAVANAATPQSSQRLAGRVRFGRFARIAGICTPEQRTSIAGRTFKPEPADLWRQQRAERASAACHSIWMWSG